MLDVDLTALVRPREHRVRREVRKRVAGVPRDHLANEAAPEEQRAEARERQHLQREARVTFPPLTNDLARGRSPATVADDNVQCVAGTDVFRYRIGYRDEPIRHG